MPDPYFFNDNLNNDLQFTPRTALSAVIEIVDYDAYVEAGKYYDLQLFYYNLAEEVHKAIKDNYRRGFNVINPEFRIISNRIYLFSMLYLEDNVPELSSMVFNLFVDTCNMILTVSLNHGLIIRGIGGVDKLINTKISSGRAGWLEKKDTLILSDMLKVFSFDEIFPDGLDKVFIPPASLNILHCENFLKSEQLLSGINAAGIYFPDNLRNYPAAELAIYSDMLLETSLKGNKVFVSNWLSYANKHQDYFNIDELKRKLTTLADEKRSGHSDFWKKFIIYSR